jgi:hypothetical protein
VSVVRLIQDGNMPLKYFLIGDDAYPGHDQLVTPFPGCRLSAVEDDFNFYQSSTRIRIEMAFGRLMQRFGILWKPLRCKLQFAPAVVMSCMILHNLCMENDCFNVATSDHVSVMGLIPNFATVPDGNGGAPVVHDQDDCYQMDDAGNKRAKAMARIRNKNKKKMARRGFMAADLAARGYHRPKI